MNLALELEQMAGEPGPEFMPPAPMDYNEKLSLAKRGMDRYQFEANILLDTVRDLVIKDVGGSAKAAELKAEAQKIAKEIDKRVKELIETDEIEAMKKYVQAVKNFGANLKAPLSEAKAEADKKLSVWAEHERQERAKQAKAAAEAAAKLQAQFDKDAKKAGIEPVQMPAPVLPPQKTVIRTDTGTTYEKRTLVPIIVDPDQVPRKYCVPDMTLLRNAVKDGVREIPGVKISEETKMVTITK